MNHKIYTKSYQSLCKSKSKVKCTVCPRSSNPFYICKLLYKMGHYFLDTYYVMSFELTVIFTNPFLLNMKELLFGGGSSLAGHNTGVNQFSQRVTPSSLNSSSRGRRQRDIEVDESIWILLKTFPRDSIRQPQV